MKVPKGTPLLHRQLGVKDHINRASEFSKGYGDKSKGSVE